MLNEPVLPLRLSGGITKQNKSFFANFEYKNVLRILFLNLKYNIYIIHMSAALAELCLLGNKTLLSPPNGIYWPHVWPLVLVTSLESLNYKHAKVLV